LSDRKEQAYSLGDLGIAYYSLGEYGTARACHEEQLELSVQIDDDMQMRSALGSLAHVDQAVGAFDRAIASYQQLRALAEAAGDRVRVCGALSGLGNGYRQLGHFEEAILAYESCLAIAREMGQRRSEAVALMGLAMAHNAMGLSERALGVAQEAWVIVQGLQSDSLKAQAVQLLAQIAVSLQNYEAAIEYEVEAIALFEAMGDRPNLGLALFNLGGVMLALGETDDVFGCWLRSLMVFIKLELEPRMQTVMRALFGYLAHAVDATFLDRPVTAERIGLVWKVPLDEIAEEHGQEMVTAMVARLVAWNQGG
jgi:tetratricopeptide (TPR) repeat protein